MASNLPSPTPNLPFGRKPFFRSSNCLSLRVGDIDKMEVPQGMALLKTKSSQAEGWGSLGFTLIPSLAQGEAALPAQEGNTSAR
jgi:hypothetical protein